DPRGHALHRHLWSLRAHRTSNILFGVVATAAFTTAIIAQRDDRPEVPAVLILESGLLSSGLTNTAKELVRRPRPYLYNPAVPASVHRKGEDAVSFWSGHTANMAAITFSAAAIVQRSDVSSDAKLATWLGAAAAPALMGYLRVRAGRHFPSDVLVGYLVGAAVGLAVPYIHQPRTAH
ncbi:MAG TPA: phosphatase PAP2 family protein, partial [Flavobacteriales bacterium]|nr:phosphatase PAP2 family protein [Flavobacteriales bacterium]